MAVALTADELAAAAGIDGPVAARLLPVVTAIVEEYAPMAPEALQNEAAIRLAGYLDTSGGSGFGAIRGSKVGPVEVEPVTNNSAAFRNSGAEALLSRSKRRRAGAI